jgi:hypothetical protein
MLSLRHIKPISTAILSLIKVAKIAMTIALSQTIHDFAIAKY